MAGIRGWRWYFPAGLDSLIRWAPGDLRAEMATDVVPPPSGDHAPRIRTTVSCLPAHDIGQLADV